MAFPGEKLFAFLFLNGGCAPPLISSAGHGRRSMFEPLSSNSRDGVSEITSGYPPLNGATPMHYRKEFTVSARTVSLTAQS